MKTLPSKPQPREHGYAISLLELTAQEMESYPTNREAFNDYQCAAIKLKEGTFIYVYDPEIRKPMSGRTVLVEGGIAAWNGVHWVSLMPESLNRPIEWEVKWWAPMITSADVRMPNSQETVRDEVSQFTDALENSILKHQIESLIKQVCVLWPTLTFWQRVDWAKAVTASTGVYPEGKWIEIGWPMIRDALSKKHDKIHEI